MDYKLIITEHAEEVLDGLIYYLINRLKNESAATHLFDSIEKIYDRLEENPYQFPECRDQYLKRMGYREAVVTDMSYLVIFRIEKCHVYVVGIFHGLENYQDKLTDGY